MGWFIDRIAKTTVAAGSFGYKAVGNTPFAAGMTGLTVAGYAGMAVSTEDQADNKAIHYAKYGTALGIDIVQDSVLNWGLTAASKLPGLKMMGGPLGMGIQIAANALGPGFIAAFDHMDEKYNQMRNKGQNYQMSQSSAQAMQRQMQNLQGAGSNLAEMMHN